MAEKYIVIGFSEVYKEDGIEAYYAEIRHEGDNGDSSKDEFLSGKFTETEIREVAEQKSKELGIPFLPILMI